MLNANSNLDQAGGRLELSNGSAELFNSDSRCSDSSSNFIPSVLSTYNCRGIGQNIILWT